MIAKRRQNPPQAPAPQPRLLRPVEEIKSQIDERVTLGQELLDSPVTDLRRLEARQDDYYSWDEYNERLLRNAFDSAARIVSTPGLRAGERLLGRRHHLLETSFIWVPRNAQAARS